MSQRGATTGATLVGRRLGDFVVGERIGEGGFGAVHGARQVSLGRDAVVKVLHGRHQAKPAIIERFLREARLASRLEHPYAAHVYAFGAEPDGLLWIAMELVRGTSMAELLRLRGPMPADQAVPLLEKIAEVVHTAHEQGIVHRDLKPANVVLISRAGRLLPKLLDFGIAKALDGPPDPAPARAAGGSPVDPGVTRPDDLFGSPWYMAPEQWINAPTVDARADIYALGAMTFEMVTGRVPFDGESLHAIAFAHAESPVPPLPGALPRALHGVIARAMAKDAGDRYATALELAAAARAAAGLTDAAPALPRLDPAVRDEVLARAPQPVAEAVAALDATRNAHHARDAMRGAVAVAARVVGVLAIACRSRVGASGDRPAADARLRALAREGLSDADWVALARELCAPFARHADAFPVPELVGLWFGADGAELPRADQPFAAALEHCAGELDPFCAEHDALAHVRAGLPPLTRLLTALSFLGHYVLGVPRDGLVERWNGLRRAPRAVDHVASGELPPDRPVLLDAERLPVLALWPLVQAGRPTATAPEELFWIDGPGRHGARLVAHPVGFHRHDDAVWPWFAAHLLDAADAAQTAGTEGRPYPGLASFTAADAALFFGREREAEAFANRLRVQPAVALVGPSGAGKSSFLAAGVIPELPESWLCATMRPGAAPLSALAAALRRAGLEVGAPAPATLREPLLQQLGDRRVVVIVDQAEELFTLCHAADERERFASALAAVARSVDDPVRVVFALRDDFLAHAQTVPALRDVLAAGLQLLGTPDRDDLLRIVTQPALRCGYAFEDDELPGEMVDAVAGAPGALALLAFTAARLWELRDRHFRRLSRAAYRALGGVGGALTRHAEDTLAEMTADDRATVREVFRHLVTAEGTRSVMRRDELADILGTRPRADAVVERLIAARLLVAYEGESGGDAVEIIHEALLAAWPRLMAWQREDREGARLRDQLRAAARQWDERGRPRGLLWRDDALAEYRLWRSRWTGQLTAIEEAFAGASLGAASRGRRVRGALLLGAFALLTAGLVVMLVLARRADDQRARAQRSSREAVQRLKILNEEQGRQALLAGDAQAALVYLSEAYALGADSRALRLMLATATRSVEAERHSLRGHRGRLWSVEYGPDGARLVTAGEDGSARVWDARTGAPLATLAGGDGDGDVFVARFSPDGARIITGGRDGVVRLWDADTGALRATLAGHTDTIVSAAFSGDGAIAITAGEDGTARVWRVADGAPGPVLRGHEGAIMAVAVTARGDRVVTAGLDGTARIWAADTGAQVAVLAGHDGYVMDAAIAPDDTAVATAGADGTARLWAITGGAPRFVLAGHTASVDAVQFSPDGARLVTASRDRTAKVWDARTGKPIASLIGHAGALSAARFDRTGARVVTASRDGTARIWNAASGTRLASLDGHTSAVLAAELAPDGRQVATASWDATAKLWATDTSGVVATLAAGDGVAYTGAFSPDGARVVTTVAGAARVWDAATGRLLATLPGPPVPMYGAAFSPTGAAIATTALDGTVALWDTASGRQLSSRHGHAGGALYVSFEPRGRRFITSGMDGATRAWDAATGAPLGELAGHDAPVWPAVFFPDGSRILTASEDGTARIWDADRMAELAVLAGHGGPIDHAAVSADGRWIVTVSRDKTARIWSADGGDAIAVLGGHTGALNTAAFSPDGARVVTAGEDGQLRLWARATGTLITSVKGHARSVRVVAFSPDGGLLATASEDETARLWEAGTLRLVATLEGHTGPVDRVQFAPGGDRLLTAGFDGVAMIWDIRSDSRSVQEVRRFVACRVPLALVEGQLVPRTATTPDCGDAFPSRESPVP